MDVRVQFDLKSAAAELLREYDFEMIRRAAWCDVESLREIMLRADAEGWPVRKVRDVLAGAFGWSRPLADVIAFTESLRAANFSALAT